MKQIVKSQIYELKSSRILYLILIILSFFYKFHSGGGRVQFRNIKTIV